VNEGKERHLRRFSLSYLSDRFSKRVGLRGGSRDRPYRSRSSVLDNCEWLNWGIKTSSGCQARTSAVDWVTRPSRGRLTTGRMRRFRTFVGPRLSRWLVPQPRL